MIIKRPLKRLYWSVAALLPAIQYRLGQKPMFLPAEFNLGESYRQYFRLVPAYTDALRDEAYRIRHQVYCEELAFEPQRPNRRETDEYDSQSIHLLIRSIQTGEFVGCTRIVRMRPPDPHYPLPFEKTCAATIDRTIIDPAKLPRHTIAEVSRLAVVSRFRKRKEDKKDSPYSVTDADFGTAEQPRFPYIPISLYFGSVELARLNGITHLFILTEERLASHFRKLGFNIQTIGNPVEHRGQRIPSLVSTVGVVDNLRTLIQPLYRIVAEEIAKHA